ncbi:MAG: LuxR C-terminal-related transcriptional regulator [Deltaproteobacteria bacterium]|nr:LuxR C-terminal-related transcriptional regulator [Deltaproteobacteria bacterium]
MLPARIGSDARLRRLFDQVFDPKWFEPNVPEIQNRMLLLNELQQSRNQLKLQNQRIRENERQLKRSHRLYFRLLNLTPTPLVRLDKDLKVIDANKAALELLGPRHHLLSSSFATFIDEACISDFHRLVHKGAYDGRKVEQEITLKIALGIRSPFLVRLSSIYIEGDELEGYLLDMEDLSIQKQDQAEEQKASDKLEEVNVALKVLLEKQEDQLDKLKESVAANKARIIDPILKKLSSSRLTDEQKKWAELLRLNLDKLTIDFAKKLSSPVYDLSPRELEVANLIRSGWTSDEIAEMQNITLSCVWYHRNNIRKKLGLIGNKERLTIFLRRIS